MYTFIIKEEGPDIDVIITRSLLALAAVASLFFCTGTYFIINLFAAVTVLFTAVFIKVLLVKLRSNKMVLLLFSAILLFIATHSITFPVILLVYGYLAKFLKKKPVILLAENGVTIKKLFSNTTFNWSEFSNVVLKDNLLTLDFKNNKLIQVAVDEMHTSPDEQAFNEFCVSCI